MVMVVRDVCGWLWRTFMGVDECGGAQRYGGTQKRAKGRHKWSCREMNHGQWTGKFPQNTGMVSDGM